MNFSLARQVFFMVAPGAVGNYQDAGNTGIFFAKAARDRFAKLPG
jgi:hypothetical protein